MDALREEIRQLFLRHERGDIREKDFQAALVRLTTELYRAAARARMAEGEKILEEHYVVRAHTRLTQSVLNEPRQEAVSIFATDRRLIRLRSTLTPGQPPSCDEKDDTVVADVPYDRIAGLQIHRRIRLGEVLVSLVFGAIGLLFHSWLSLTGPLLIALGVLGVLHGLLLPTRWAEVEIQPPSPAPILIYATRKKSGRRVLRLLSQKARPGSPPRLAVP